MVGVLGWVCIRMTLSNISGLTAININYSLNGPAVGTNFPLAVDGANVTAASATAQGTVSLSNQSMGAGDKYFSGNVGIGTTTPTRKLHVNGAVNISDGNTDRFVMSFGGGGVVLNNNDNSSIVFATNNTTGGQISSGGVWTLVVVALLERIP